MGWLSRNISSAFNDVVNFATSVVTAPIQVIGNVVGQVGSTATSAVSTAGGLANQAMNVAGGVAGQATDIIEDNPALVAGVAAALGAPTLGLGMGSGSSSANTESKSNTQEWLSKYWYVLLVIPLFLMMKKK